MTGPARLAAAEAALIKALVPGPHNTPRPHALLGVAQIITNRAAQGIAECEQALALEIEIWPTRMLASVLPKIISVVPRKPRPISTRRSASRPTISARFGG